MDAVDEAAAEVRAGMRDAIRDRDTEAFTAGSIASILRAHGLGRPDARNGSELWEWARAREVVLQPLNRAPGGWRAWCDRNRDAERKPDIIHAIAETPVAALEALRALVPA